MNSILNILITKDEHISSKLERNTTFDIARGFAVLFMIMTHVASTYSNTIVSDSWFYSITDFLGGPPAAPVFVLLMGVFFVVNQKETPLQSNIFRGVKLFLLGVILSYLREDILYLFYGDLQFNTTVWEVDILQFAGGAYILMSIIYHYFKKPITWLIISFIIIIISPLLWGNTSNNIIIKWFFHLLWGNGELTYFPIFPWLCYPLIGMVLGAIFKSLKDTSIVLNNLLKPGIVLLMLGSIISYGNFEFHIGDYFRSGPGSIVWMLGFVFIWLWFLHKIPKNKVSSLLASWGKRTTSIYIVHWLLISWGTMILGYESSGYLAVIFYMILFSVTSHYITKYIRIKI